MNCRIEKITELDGITPKLSHLRRVGSTGDLLSISVGFPMCIIYSDGHGTLTTSVIDDISEELKGFTVKTHNSIYVLEKV